MPSTFALALAATLGIAVGPEQARILEAAESACQGDIHCEATTITWWAQESRLATHPKCYSDDCKAHRSCGFAQMPCVTVERMTIESQAREWMARRGRSLESCRELPENERMAELASGTCRLGHILSRSRYELAQDSLEVAQVLMLVGE
jgi:hypothetical protein